MKKEKLFISTVCNDDYKLAKKYGLGLEIAEFCTAYNMDKYYKKTIKIVNKKIKYANNFIFHAPFNELCPSAIDPKIKQIAFERYIQAFKIAKQLGIKKIVIHSGFVPLIYYPSYFVEQSIIFYKKLLKHVDKDINICLENVMEDSPDMLVDIVKGVNDDRFGLCLDVGHAFCVSSLSLKEWIEKEKDYIKHYHIHNNFGQRDEHNSLDKGNIDFIDLFNISNKLTKDATYTIESMDANSSIQYLIDKGILED